MWYILGCLLILWFITLIAKGYDLKKAEENSEKVSLKDKVAALETQVRQLQEQKDSWKFNAEYWKERYNNVNISKGV